MSLRILVVEDDQDIAEAARFLLGRRGHALVLCHDLDSARAALAGDDFDLMLLDMNLSRDTTSGQEGLDFLQATGELRPPTIAMTAWANVALAVQAMQAGAVDFIEKPWNNARLLELVDKHGRTRRLEAENRQLKQLDSPDQPLGQSRAMTELLAMARQVAPTRANVLITGENGTGKSMLAQYLHGHSDRADQAFVAVNMGAIPETLFESELFGHRKGAFTDAKTERLGRFAMAEGGTLFLDEVATLPPAQQVKLLRVLESGDYEVLGDSHTRKADVRLIAATNADLHQAMAAGEFRRDLYFRLNTVELRLPPLRERPDDIPLLAAHFLARHGRRYGRDQLRLEPEALGALAAYGWPGNVRELSHVMERAVLMARGDSLGAADLALTASAPPPQGEPALAPLAQVEKQLILKALAQTGNSIGLAAERLGLSRHALSRRLEKHDIQL
ncbi:sigma-54 dependent transcriptional regulator [Gallaecimonas sp. GXIMD4217]|uniref:sigma-54-dependent transcriptional regulator n=1 Tax=Gallaecimonas sp. GXIMD4217 TaxID=3131927 RepID=UPI00311B1BF0